MGENGVKLSDIGQVVRAVKGLCLLYPGKYKARMGWTGGRVTRAVFFFFAARIREYTKTQARIPVSNPNKSQFLNVVDGFLVIYG